MWPPHPSRRAPRYVCMCGKHMCWRPPQDEADKVLRFCHDDSYPGKSALASRFYTHDPRSRWRDRGRKRRTCDGHHTGGWRGGARLWLFTLPRPIARRECTMNRASLNSLFFLLGIVLMSFSGSRLSQIVGVTWEFAAFGVGIVWAAACGSWLQTKKRIDDLEKKVSDLESGRKVQA